MIVSLDEMKNYLRVDFDEDDLLIEYLLKSAEQICMDILRTDEVASLEQNPNAKTALLYTTAYLYEHREEADHRALMITLRALLGGNRKEVF